MKRGKRKAEELAFHSEKLEGSEKIGESEQAHTDTEKSEDDGVREDVVESVDRFEDMSLDVRVLSAIRRMRFTRPTPIQAAVIPAALRGRDVLASAPTGSGKTAAYAIPVLDVLLRSTSVSERHIRALVLVPTRELASQVTSVFKSLLKAVGSLTVAQLRSATSKSHSKDASSSSVALSSGADILVGTPTAALEFVRGTKDVREIFSGVECVVVDEADLVLSFGYGRDTEEALSLVPTSAQSILISATMDEDVTALRKIVLRNPLTVKVSSGVVSNGTKQDDIGLENKKEAESDAQRIASQATHHYVRLKNSNDKYLVTYAMLRLGVLIGKVLVFLNDIDSAFRLKLFLDQFSIRSAVLNSELPANSRLHSIEQFNAGLFEILIAVDESTSGAAHFSKTGSKSKKKSIRLRKDSDFGAVRGLDFQNVATVLNFEMCRDSRNYVHRAGRTARAGQSGTVLSLAHTEEEEQRLQKIAREVPLTMNPLLLQSGQIDAFRYRVEDSLRAVTSAKVRDARLCDVKRELVNSERLKQYFDDNPKDRDALQHDRSLMPRVQPHLSHIPNYLLPPVLRASVAPNVPGMKHDSRSRSRKMNRLNKRRKLKSSDADPLRSFKLNNSGPRNSRPRIK